MWVRGRSWAEEEQAGDPVLPPLTVIVNSAIIVFVTILHELFNVVFCNGLSCGLQHHLQFVQVNVAVSVSTGRARGTSVLRTGWKRRRRNGTPHIQPQEAGQGHQKMGIPVSPHIGWETDSRVSSQGSKTTSFFLCFCLFLFFSRQDFSV